MAIGTLSLQQPLVCCDIIFHQQENKVTHLVKDFKSIRLFRIVQLPFTLGGIHIYCNINSPVISWAKTDTTLPLGLLDYADAHVDVVPGTTSQCCLSR